MRFIFLRNRQENRISHEHGRLRVFFACMIIKTPDFHHEFSENGPFIDYMKRLPLENLIIWILSMYSFHKITKLWEFSNKFTFLIKSLRSGRRACIKYGYCICLLSFRSRFSVTIVNAYRGYINAFRLYHCNDRRNTIPLYI